MALAADRAELPPPRDPGAGGIARLIYNPRIRSFLIQAAVLVAVVLVLYWIVRNTVDNLRRANIASGFDFFDREAGFDVAQTLIPFTASDTILTAFWVGVLNTLLVAVLGIVLATIIGLAVGLARLSPNWLLARLGTVYVETLRNIPLLVFLLFWYRAVLSVLPGPRQGFSLPFGINLSNRGLTMPAPVLGEGFGLTLAAFALGLVVAVAIAWWARRRRVETGVSFPTGRVALAVIAIPTAVVFIATGAPLAFDVPELQGFNFEGGYNLEPELVALLVGLSGYTAAFIAEVVRAGVLAVSHGQTEAAQALGLTRGQTLRRVVLPQAIRVIIPPLTNQYLNLTKNSTLAIAIGYPDFASIFLGSVNQRTGQAVEVVVITMLFYLAVSLATSLFMNWFNRRVAIKER
jgi:general L-amino acid transport system permease protein